MGAVTPRETAQARETHYELEERFGEFQSSEGLTQPARWVLRYTTDIGSRPVNLQWEILVDSISHDPHFDAATFVLKPIR